VLNDFGECLQWKIRLHFIAIKYEEANCAAAFLLRSAKTCPMHTVNAVYAPE
jgi:hypothetical protein